MKKYVAGLMFSENRECVALITKNKPDWQKGLLNGIGGKIEEDDYDNKRGRTRGSDSSLNAMRREFQEETSVFHQDWELFLTMHGGNEESDNQQYKEEWSVDFYRTFSDKVFDVKSITDENVDIYFVGGISDLNMIDNLQWIILLSLDKNPKLTKVKY